MKKFGTIIKELLSSNEELISRIDFYKKFFKLQSDFPSLFKITWKNGSIRYEVLNSQAWTSVKDYGYKNSVLHFILETEKESTPDQDEFTTLFLDYLENGCDGQLSDFEKKMLENLPSKS